MKNTIQVIDCLTGLKSMADNTVDCCVTSPPYFGLRDYGVEGQIGLEETPEAFIIRLVDVFREVRRVLKPEGTCWINIGDSYVGTSTGAGTTKSTLQGGKLNQEIAGNRPHKKAHGDLKNKDLIGIPWMLAFALRADGWYLRQDIIWSKPNPMPESVSDRCTKSHEYIFLLSKSAKYYYDQASILEPVSPNTHLRISQDLAKQIGSERANGGAKSNGNLKAVARKSTPKSAANEFQTRNNESWEQSTLLPVSERNKRSVWQVGSRGFSEAHFATFPEDLIVPCIKAGCPPNGLVLDPFMGAATTALVARKLGRNYVGFELNPDYVAIAERRLHHELGPLTALFS